MGIYKDFDNATTIQDLSTLIFETYEKELIGSNFNIRFIGIGYGGYYIGLHLPVDNHLGIYIPYSSLIHTTISKSLHDSDIRLGIFEKTGVLPNMESLALNGFEINNHPTDKFNTFINKLSESKYSRFKHIIPFSEEKWRNKEGNLEYYSYVAPLNIEYVNDIPLKISVKGGRLMATCDNMSLTTFRDCNLNDTLNIEGMPNCTGTAYLNVVQTNVFESRLKRYFNGVNLGEEELTTSTFFSIAQCKGLFDKPVDLVPFEKRLADIQEANKENKDLLSFNYIPKNIYISDIYKYYLKLKEEQDNVLSLSKFTEQFYKEGKLLKDRVDIAIKLVGKTALLEQLSKDTETGKKEKQAIKNIIEDSQSSCIF